MVSIESLADWAAFLPFFVCMIALGIYSLVISFLNREGARSTLLRSALAQALVASIVGTFAVLLSENTESSGADIAYILLMAAAIPLGGILVQVSLGRSAVRARDNIEKAAAGTFSDDLYAADGLGEYDRIESALYHMKGVLGDVIANVRASSITLASTATDLAASSEEVNATTAEVTTTIQHIAKGAAEQAERVAEISLIVDDMANLTNEAIRDIGETATSTLKIAEQTNMLALNASIEASRAGEYGKGFSVVADNIKRLSDRSRISAENISEAITNIIDRMKFSIERIIASIDSVASVAEETSAGAEEAAAAAEQQNASMQEMSNNASELAQLAGVLRQNAEKLVAF